MPRPADGRSRPGGGKPVDDRVLLKDPALLEAEIARLEAKVVSNDASKTRSANTDDKDKNQSRESAERDRNRLKMLKMQQARLRSRSARTEKLRADYESRAKAKRALEGNTGKNTGSEHGSEPKKYKYANIQGRQVVIAGRNGVPPPPPPPPPPGANTGESGSDVRAPSPPPWPPVPPREIPPPPRANRPLRRIPPPPPSEYALRQQQQNTEAAESQKAKEAPEEIKKTENNHADESRGAVRAAIDLSKYQRS
mmetsp:Transcript_17541/g.34499  ORF Transcript_17541/g.34499 Transcript_17541/m.34499 type:complete len:253 (+) Transcript_17541:82-840(+)|eukprot:CAMPEP_0171572538 /NCGR_PEP_ID=MMETSP0961-20121227/4206_1 /TAXON_ID=87120 /ORGANISM="Aurantiochytrium limacinum, Strain ATCCMYA-1381" /LENGTH=252 /DNA_ID=CAMNT_0012127451 /DNA_START=76 /DNA_END=834 /DNA_ORIENTATION=+